MTSKASFPVDRVKKWRTKARILWSFCDEKLLHVIDIQVAAGDWRTVSFQHRPQSPSSWQFHLTDTGMLCNEFVDWTNTELPTSF